MPANSIPFAIEVLAAGGILASVLVAFSGNPSMSAMVGAGIAAFLAIVRWWAKSKSNWQRSCVFAGAFFGGAVLPGGILKTWFAEKVTAIPWESWMILGFVAAILAWAIIEVLFSLSENLPGLISKRLQNRIDRELNKILPSPDGNKDRSEHSQNRGP